MSSRRTASVSLLVAMVASAGCVSLGSDDGGDSGPIERGVRAIPLSAYDSALDESRGSIEVSIGDVAAVAEARGLDEPEAGRELEDEVARWLFALSLGVDEDDSEVTLVVPQQFRFPDFPRAADEQLGLDVGAMERYASIRSSIFELLVLEGDLTLLPSLDEVSEGVFTFGDADDYEFTEDFDRSIDNLGRPVRLADTEGAVALSLSTPAIEDFLAGGPSLADEDDYLAVATALDAVGSLGAYIAEADFEFVLGDVGADVAEFEELRAGLPITESFDLVGLGMAVDDGKAVNAIVYVFSSDSRAEDAMSGVEAAWTTAELGADAGTSIDDLYEFKSIEQTGNVITVVATPESGRDTIRIMDLFFRNEVQFRHP